jgi:hypothetical protein
MSADNRSIAEPSSWMLLRSPTLSASVLNWDLRIWQAITDDEAMLWRCAIASP